MPAANLLRGQAQPVLDLVAALAELEQADLAWRILDTFYLKPVPTREAYPITYYWAAWLCARTASKADAASWLRRAQALPAAGVFPHRRETVRVLRWALGQNPNDGKAALYLGHLLFALGRHAEGRRFWRQALDHDVEPTVALRALAMACLKLDHRPSEAARLLRRAHGRDPNDPILARDLARVLFALADKAPSRDAKQRLYEQARACLQESFDFGKTRSDYIVLLARALNRLGRYAETARMLDRVHIIIWEGAREVHDLFEEAHLALGNAYLAEGKPKSALAEFNRALEYPENLATGRLETTREAHIQYWRGQALMALHRNQEALAAWRKAAQEPPSNKPAIKQAQQKAKDALQKWQSER